MLFQSGTVSCGRPSSLGCGMDPGGGALEAEDAGLPRLGELNIEA
jgi:hypothetical protein